LVTPVLIDIVQECSDNSAGKNAGQESDSAKQC
jgi:hypothetical protein